ncbi:MAG: dTDP-4-dehydrorhamnose 3,5-epimerase [Chitinophagaceae bacterium]
MKITQTIFPGVLLIEPTVFEDNRGYFFESYSQKNFAESNMAFDWVQDNQSSSAYGVIRGLHYQLNPFAQSKLVRVFRGSILDIIVDIRKGSPQYGKHFAVELSAENKMQLLVPQGFAHGFSVLSESAEILYKCDNYYHKNSEAGIIYNDPELAINWQVPADKMIVSEKDLILPGFADIKTNFEFSA